jgi:glyoxylase-like metal-dependent hydrolase (beta-lactamase superfamily II)
MPNFICTRCGVQFPETAAPPSHCPICQDDRQYLGPNGQEWTTLPDLARTSRNITRPIEPGITGISTEPVFAIGQRAMLIETPAGNILWDCITFIDDETVKAVKSRGGLAAIALSHPHYYSSIVEWSRRLGGVPVYLHADDADWAMRRDPCLVFWSGERREILPGATLIRVGGHFPGSSVLHWQAGASGKGSLHTGDSVYVAADKRYVSFMYSYPNLIPLPASAIRRIAEALDPFPFDRLYGAWWDAVVPEGAKMALEVSAQRYIDAISERPLSISERGFDASLQGQK